MNPSVPRTWPGDSARPSREALTQQLQSAEVEVVKLAEQLAGAEATAAKLREELQ